MHDPESRNWREASFATLADYANGRAFKPEDWGKKGLPIIRIAQITNPGSATDFYDGEVEPRHRIENGDLIFSWSATLAVMRWERGPAVLNQHLFKVTPVEGIDRRWLQYRLEASIPDLADEAHGTTMKHIRKGTLASKTTLVPPLDEQRRIAEVLRSVDEAIAAAQAAAAQAHHVLGGHLSLIMERGLALHEEYGPGGLPNGWSEGRCDDYFVLQRGFDITESQAVAGPFHVISSSGPSYSHSEAAVAGPAVITGRKGRLGTVFFSPDPCWPHDTTLWVKDFKGNHPRFVYWKLREMKLNAYDAATSVPTLNRNNVHALLIRFPPLEEQREIAEILDAQEDTVARAEATIEALVRTKAVLADDLLSGRVRVPA
ncbi:restriction endonuclease subunit S [uncultured Caulobacter sp.]|uniref:restriction endonuclease subunit S n=1 Tax=uncultured Caulobacter sp. TaxID=158749 RepID=UPI00260A2D59|nr:restriction endonuclease subunit S [uncultured Caulobacter sp.]